HNPMQMSFQPSNLACRANVLFVCASLSPLLFPASLHCDPYASTWASGQKSSLRLIAAGGGPPQGFYRAGIEVRLDPGALTYWRMPGGAGVPPVFSFEGSANASDIAVSYPAPTRIDEDGTEAFGYRDRVIFPVRVTPKDAARPVLLVLNVSYAVCSRICLPAKAEARLTLLPVPEAGTARPEAAAIAAAEAAVPLRLTPEQRDAKVAITRDETALAPTWRLSSRGGGAQDLFAEAPPGWYFETRKSGRPDEFLIVEVEKPRTYSRALVPVILTLRNEQQSYEFAVDLDAAPVP
ncbi:MAG: protein-disulfide reductase DsbD domain-containing protein, partial [Methylocella sp.]